MKSLHEALIIRMKGDDIEEVTRESRVPCASAMEIAKSLGIPAAAVGKTADKLNIRIKKCQIGCF